MFETSNGNRKFGKAQSQFIAINFFWLALSGDLKMEGVQVKLLK
jgi:hypothetical protein